MFIFIGSFTLLSPIYCSGGGNSYRTHQKNKFSCLVGKIVGWTNLSLSCAKHCSNSSYSRGQKNCPLIFSFLALQHGFSTILRQNSIELWGKLSCRKIAFLRKWTSYGPQTSLYIWVCPLWSSRKRTEDSICPGLIVAVQQCLMARFSKKGFCSIVEKNYQFFKELSGN